MKNYKRNILILLSVLLSSILISFAGCNLLGNRTEENAKEHIKDITNIDIPRDAKLLYRCADDDFGPGRKSHLTVYQFEKEPTEWLNENKFLTSEDDSLLVAENEHHFLEYFDFSTHDKNKIPREYVPDFDKFYKWICPARVHFFYYPDTLRLIVYVAWG